MKKFFQNLTNRGQKASPKKADRELIQRAYDARKEEIKSLSQYDRGEKHIEASDLRKLVRSI